MILLFRGAAMALDPDSESGGEEAGESLDLSAWQRYFDEAKEAHGRLGDFASVEEMIGEIAEAGYDEDAEASMSSIWSFIVPNLNSALKRLLSVTAIALLTGACGIVFEKKDGVGRALLLMLCASAILAITAALSSAASASLETVALTADFGEASAPILSFIMTAAGCAGSAKLLAPKLVLLSSLISVLIKSTIMPLLMLSGVLAVVNSLSDTVKLERAVKLLHKTVKWLIGLFSTVFSAVTVLGGLSAGAADSVSLRTAKFALDKLLPSGGGLVTGSFDTISAGAVLVKNSVGITAIVLLLALVARPLLGIGASVFAFRITAAVCESFSDEKIPKLLDSVADTVSYMFAAAASSCALFVLTVVMMIASCTVMR